MGQRQKQFFIVELEKDDIRFLGQAIHLFFATVGEEVKHDFPIYDKTLRRLMDQTSVVSEDPNRHDVFYNSSLITSKSFQFREFGENSQIFYRPIK